MRRTGRTTTDRGPCSVESRSTAQLQSIQSRRAVRADRGERDKPASGDQVGVVHRFNDDLAAQAHEVIDGEEPGLGG